MPNEGEWGYCGSYSIVVRVSDNQKKTINSSSSRGSPTFSGVKLTKIDGKWSAEEDEKILNDSFWERSSCKNENHNFVLFGQAEVYYSTWNLARLERERKQLTLPTKVSYNKSKVMGNTNKSKTIEADQEIEEEDEEKEMNEINFPKSKGN